MLKTLMIKGLESLYVCDLITERIACWNENLVKTLFSLIDVIVILSIPLSTRQVEDNIIWHHIKTRVYLCKSSYHAAIDINRPNLGDHIDEDWHKLWNLKIPIRIKHFFWRVCHHCIPTCIRLVEKEMKVSNICVICEEAREYREHAFFQCSFAITYWHDQLLVVVFSLFDILDKEKKEQVDAIIWSLWKQYNEKLWHNKMVTVSSAIKRGIVFLNQ